MNLLRLSFFLILTMTIAACGSDDDSAMSCDQSDWVGVYTGTIDCDGTSEDVTVTITASGSEAIIIKYETTTVETEFDPLTPEGCDLNASSSAGGITLTVEASLDGDDLTFKDVLTVAGSTETCNITATR